MDHTGNLFLKLRSKMSPFLIFDHHRVTQVCGGVSCVVNEAHTQGSPSQRAAHWRIRDTEAVNVLDFLFKSKTKKKKPNICNLRFFFFFCVWCSTMTLTNVYFFLKAVTSQYWIFHPRIKCLFFLRTNKQKNSSPTDFFCVDRKSLIFFTQTDKRD